MIILSTFFFSIFSSWYSVQSDGENRSERLSFQNVTLQLEDINKGGEKTTIDQQDTDLYLILHHPIL